MGFLEKLTSIKIGWTFQPGNLNEYNGRIKNPGRGWYQIHTFLIENEPDLDEMEWSISKHDTLAAAVIDIGSSRNRSLEKVELERIRKILNFFKENKYEVILRIVYDHEGLAIEREPDVFSMIQTHIEQLWAIISDFDDTVFVYQGMLIGNWGEMHTSKFLAPERVKRLGQTMIENKSYQPFLAVRRPKFWRMLHEPGTDLRVRPQDRMGLFDDAIFGSATDLGTYGDQGADSAGWESSWRREDELEFEEKLCRNVPNGGEVVYGENYTDGLTVDEILSVLYKKHITYLNRLHDSRLLDIWKGMKPFQTGIWKEKTFYEYVSAHLGYRFFVQKIIVKPDKSNSRDFISVEISIENQGFANLYEEAELSLLCEKTDGLTEKIVLSVDMRKWNAKETYTILQHLKVFEGSLYLSARRKKDNEIIRFVNVSSEERVFLGALAKK